MKRTSEDELRRLRIACAEATTLLTNAVEGMRRILKDRTIIRETPRDAKVMMDAAVRAMSGSLRRIRSGGPVAEKAPPAGAGPTRQQGQFLAYIRHYISGNSAGVAPSHADLQRFFNLTAPSVNSMLIRLEQRGFIRREPGQARAIELVVDPDWIPSLERPFKY